MNKKKRVRISPPHLTVFLLVYLGNFLLFFALRGYFFLVMAILLTAFVPLSFCMAWLLTGSVAADIACRKLFLQNR